jgi:DNA-binding NtrC family response regulator
LGLSQVYGFARQSGGAVAVASELGRGTTIAMYLPRTEAPPSVLPESAGLPVAPRAEGTILAIEDNREVADVTARMLEDIGYRVLRAQNAADALLLLQRNSNIDLVFSDIVMPGAMNGLALAREISTRFPKMPVVLTSGYSDAIQTVRSQFAILRKPFQAADLERTLREALRQSGPQQDPSSGMRSGHPAP